MPARPTTSVQVQIAGSPRPARFGFVEKWAILVTLTLTLIWLRFEDRTLIFPYLLVLPLGGLIARLCIQKLDFGWIGSGFIGGLVISPALLLLIAFKTGIHGHEVPDFSSAQILYIVQTSPAWTLAGGLVGWALKRIHTRLVARASVTNIPTPGKIR